MISFYLIGALFSFGFFLEEIDAKHRFTPWKTILLALFVATIWPTFLGISLGNYLFNPKP